LGSFHYKGRRPAVSAGGARGGVRDTRVFGASVLLAEGASQKPQNGIRTRGSQGPDDSLGHTDHMEHPRGAFKANSARFVRSVKELLTQTTPRPLVSTSNDQNSCKKFSQIATTA
jgi:hypothetical protein